MWKVKPIKESGQRLCILLRALRCQRTADICLGSSCMSSCIGCCRRSRGYAVSRGSQQTAKSELLVLGLEGAGKSLLMRQLSNLANGLSKAIPHIQPTVGVELYKISMHSKYKSLVVQAREVGGSLLPVWPQYYDSANSLIYVIAITATSKLAAAVMELQNILQHPSIQGKPACIVLHKQDSHPGPLSPAIIDHVLDMDGLGTAHPNLLTVVHVSTNAGLPQLLRWVKDNCLQ